MTATITVGSSPWGVAVDPAAGAVYVANEDGGGSGLVSVIDAATGTVTDTLDTGFGADAVAVDPATHTVYETNTGDDTVLADNENGNRSPPSTWAPPRTRWQWTPPPGPSTWPTPTMARCR